MTGDYDPAADPVHGSGWNSAARWGGWDWREPRDGDHFRTCSFCGCIHPEDLAAEQAGDGVCRVCGQHGWEGCFRAQPLGVSTVELDRLLGDPSIPGEEKARLRGEHPAHPYDPGGWYASWADRKYGFPHKFYVEGLRPRDPSLLHVLSHITHDPATSAGWAHEQQWVAAKDLTRQQRQIVKADGWLRDGEKPDGWYMFQPRATLHAKFYTRHLADPRISDEVKEKIQQASGLWLKFTADGYVRWAATRELLEQSA